MMEGHLLSVEFRNKTWFDARPPRARPSPSNASWAWSTRSSTGRRALPTAFPRVWEATHPRLALLRLHGRNQDTWNIKSSVSSSRFNYWYSQDELAAMVPDIRRIAGLADALHVVFNTNYEDQGQVNARLLARLLQ